MCSAESELEQDFDAYSLNDCDCMVITLLEVFEFNATESGSFARPLGSADGTLKAALPQESVRDGAGLDLEPLSGEVRIPSKSVAWNSCNKLAPEPALNKMELMEY